MLIKNVIIGFSLRCKKEHSKIRSILNLTLCDSTMTLRYYAMFAVELSKTGSWTAQLQKRRSSKPASYAKGNGTYPMCHWKHAILWLDCQALADHATTNSKVASQPSRHDLPTNPTSLSLMFDLGLFSSASTSFCFFWAKFGLFLATLYEVEGPHAIFVSPTLSILQSYTLELWMCHFRQRLERLKESFLANQIFRIPTRSLRIPHFLFQIEKRKSFLPLKANQYNFSKTFLYIPNRLFSRIPNL